MGCFCVCYDDNYKIKAIFCPSFLVGQNLALMLSSASHTKEYLVDMHKFPQEYNEMLTTKSKNIFKHWIYKKIDILTYIYQNYTKLLEEGTRK